LFPKREEKAMTPFDRDWQAEGVENKINEPFDLGAIRPVGEAIVTRNPDGSHTYRQEYEYTTACSPIPISMEITSAEKTPEGGALVTPEKARHMLSAYGPPPTILSPEAQEQLNTIDDRMAALREKATRHKCAMYGCNEPAMPDLSTCYDCSRVGKDGQPAEPPEVTRNRLKTFLFSGRAVLDFLKGLATSQPGDVVACDLPSDIPAGAEVVNVATEHNFRGFLLTLRHPSFEVVRDGERIPEQEVGWAAPPRACFARMPEGTPPGKTAESERLMLTAWFRTARPGDQTVVYLATIADISRAADECNRGGPLNYVVTPEAYRDRPYLRVALRREDESAR
jgi:hypothetical protein